MRKRLAAIWSACALAGRAAPYSLAWYLLCSLVEAAAPVSVAWLTKLVLDQVAAPRPQVSALLVLAVGLAAASALTATVPHASRYLRSEMERRVGVLAQDRLFTAVGRFSGLARFENPRFLDRLRLAQQSADRTPNQVVEGAVGVVRGVLTAGGFLGSLAVLSPVIAAAVLGAAVPALLAELALSRRRARMLWEIGPTERREVFYTELLGSVQAAKEIRLFGTGGFLRGRMLGERRSANAAYRGLDRRELATQGGLGLLGALVAGAGLVWAVGAARTGRLTVGDLSMFLAALVGVQTALRAMVTELAGAHHALLMFEHYLEILRAEPDLSPPRRRRRAPALRRGIEVRDVWFRYAEDHPWVLRGVNLTIPHAAAVGLVGRNGAGKTTLVKLLCRFYDPVVGAIFWDGVDLRDIPPDSLRARIGAVFQDYMCYDLTAAENIALGDLDVAGDRGRIEAAAHRAGVHDTLAGLPYGYDTLLSRVFFSESDKHDAGTGVVLSGGQWQRVALARAFLRDRRDLMILDEPSAGLDAEAEHAVHTRLREHRAGRTSLLISHRLGAIRDATSIAVLDEGRIVEQGEHAELMSVDGAYAHLFHLQAEGYQPAVPAGGSPEFPTSVPSMKGAQ